MATFYNVHQEFIMHREFILITAIKLFILNKVPLKNTVYAYRFRHAINWPTNVDLKMQGDFS